MLYSAEKLSDLRGCLQGQEGSSMATLEELEQRVTELERVVLPALRREQIDTKPVEERLNALQQQVAELQRRLSAQEQNTGQLGQTAWPAARSVREGPYVSV